MNKEISQYVVFSLFVVNNYNAKRKKNLKYENYEDTIQYWLKL